MKERGKGEEGMIGRRKRRGEAGYGEGEEGEEQRGGEMGEGLCRWGGRYN